jgi:hypothetical protein
MTDQRDEDRDDRVQRYDADDLRMSRRGEIDPLPLRRGRFRDGDDYGEDHASSAAHVKVRAPGLALVLIGWVGVLLSLALVGFGVATPFLMVVPKGGPPAGPEIFIFPVVYGGMGLASLTASAFVIVGGSRMRQCRSWGLALTAAILCMASVLVFGICGAVGMGFGIWALVVLSSSEVKEEFERVARRGTRETEGW